MTGSPSILDVQKRCACGRSTTYPLCDGSHSSEGWRCSAVTEAPINLGFIGGPHLVNLADRLAHGLGGISVHSSGVSVRVNELIVLTDGSDVQWLRQHIRAVEAIRTRVIGVGVELQVLQWAFPTHTCVTVSDDQPTALWTNVVSAVRAQPMPQEQSVIVRPRVFVSHAVADEGQLYPVLNTLREQYGLELFVCADSIPVGEAWQDEIRRQLVACDLFLLVSSRSVMTSTYCAFEVGVATALEKPIRVIALEEDSTPAYLAHLQGMSVERLLMRKPWLMPDEALLDAILNVVIPPSPGDAPRP